MAGRLRAEPAEASPPRTKVVRCWVGGASLPHRQTALPWESCVWRRAAQARFHARWGGARARESITNRFSHLFQGDPGEDGRPVSVLFSNVRVRRSALSIL